MTNSNNCDSRSAKPLLTSNQPDATNFQQTYLSTWSDLATVEAVPTDVTRDSQSDAQPSCQQDLNNT